MFHTNSSFQLVSKRVHLFWFHYLSVILNPLCVFAMDSVLYASMDVLDVIECNMPCVCENASMSVYPHDCDAMLNESLGVVDLPNIKLLKK